MLTVVRKSPLPKKIKIFFKTGRILGFFLMVQIITGVLLVCYFKAQDGFYSLVFLSREVFYRNIVRIFHAAGASFYFFFLYFHIFRGIFFRRFLLNRKLWLRGCLIFLISQAIAFLGYILPGGQMSF